MKIASIATSQIPSTTANSIQVMKVCQALVQLGHSTELWVPGKQPDGVDWNNLASQYGITNLFPIHWLSMQKGWKRYDLAWQASQAAESWGADLIYTWMPQTGLFGLIRGMPVVLEIHDRVTGKLGPVLFQSFLRWPGKKRVLTVTNALRLILERRFHYPFPENEIQIAPNGVDLGRYRGLPDPPAARRQLDLPEKVTVGYTGHFYPGRGMDVLVSLAKCYPEVQFLWVGGNPEAVRDWQTQLDGEGIRNVILTGFVDNQVLPLYQAAVEILLMPYERSIAGSGGGNSADICSPMKMFEYMAAGRAILTSDLPVIREVLNENNAVFCPPEDALAWESALGRLLADPSQRERIAAQANQDVQAYSWMVRAEHSIIGLG